MTKLNPYAWLAALVIVASLGTGLYLWGRNNGVESMRDKVAAKDEALGNAAGALRAARAAIIEINKDAEERIRIAAAQDSAASAAPPVLDAKRDDIRKRAEKEDARWAKAKRIPTCADLLNADLLKTCGVPIR